jgi:hypothetical protein
MPEPQLGSAPPMPSSWIQRVRRGRGPSTTRMSMTDALRMLCGVGERLGGDVIGGTTSRCSRAAS